MSVVAAIQYALFRDPNHRVFGNTDAAKCTAAIRLPDNGRYLWANQGWWAESWSNWTAGSPTADASPGGSIQYNVSGAVQLSGSTIAENARSTLRDNGNHQAPFGNISLRQSQHYGILIETRIRVSSVGTSALVFVGMSRAHSTTASLVEMERMLGIISSTSTSNWRAVTKRNDIPSDGIASEAVLIDFPLGVASNQADFLNCVIEVSGEGKSARWRTSTGPWTNNKIPVTTTATSENLLSRRNEGPVDFGVQVREWEDDFIAPTATTTAVVSRLNIWAWRPGYVATRPVYRYN